MKFRVGIFVLALASAWLAVAGAGSAHNDFTFVILGDRTGTPQPGVYEHIWDQVAAERPAFVINAGDTIDGGNDATVAAEWAALRPIWRKCRGCPFYLVPGNHDIFSERSRALWTTETGHPPAYGFDFQNAHFTVLDNSQTLELSAGQLEFLRRDLERNRSRAPKFIFFHKPYWLLYVKLGSSDFALHKIAQEFGVGYVVSGHGHEFVPSERDGIAYIEVGSSGGKLKGTGFSKGWFYHHLLVRVRGEKAEITVKEAAPPDGNGRSFRLDQWDEISISTQSPSAR